MERVNVRTNDGAKEGFRTGDSRTRVRLSDWSRDYSKRIVRIVVSGLRHGTILDHRGLKVESTIPLITILMVDGP